MPTRKWTPAQTCAIEDEGGALLVSAAAGSGKTAVLVERAVRLVAKEQGGIDADSLLILTFTNAAAEELRGRIAARLEQEIAKNPSTRLQKQRLLLRRAFVGTIDAFCLQLVKENFAALDLPPDITLGDDALLAQLEQQALDETMEEMITNEAFSQFSAMYGRSRSDAAGAQTVQALHRYTRTLPYPNSHIMRFAEMYNNAQPLEDSIWGVYLLQEAEDAVFAARAACAENMNRVLDDDALAPYMPVISEDTAAIEQLAEALNAGWDEACACVHAFKFAALRACKADEESKNAVKNGRQQVKDIIADLQNKVFVCTCAEYQKDLADAAPMVQALAEAAVMFGEKFHALKLAEGVLDFADFEHLALGLLQKENGERTTLAQQVSARYGVVMVDEYQDTNELQSALYENIAAENGENLFYVGDVKQSIYRFRNANPGIFLQKKNSWQQNTQGEHPAVVHLGHNFRSRADVIDGVNYIFTQLMCEKLGEVDYTETERLIAGAQDAEADEASAFELCIVQGEGENEAEYVAARIAEMVKAGVTVHEGGEARPCRYEDFCIILRVKKRMPQFMAALKAAGVPAVADLTDNLLTAPEVLPLTAVLRAIDNPGDDISVASALLGPLFNFTADEVAALRADAPRGRLWAGLCKSENAKAQAFVKDIRFYRVLSGQVPVGRLCEEIAHKTGYLSAVAAMEDGVNRREKLHRFMGWAQEAGSAGRGGLAGFVRMLNSGTGPQPPAIKTVAGHVSVLTVHKSKGLEFPFCFLADARHGFNNRAQAARVCMHAQLGVGLALRSGTALYPTLPQAAIKAKIAAEERSEELRALYVALTRAKQQMIVTFPENDPARYVAKRMAVVSGEKPDPWLMKRAQSYADWLLAALLRHHHSAPLYNLVGGFSPPAPAAEGRFNVVVAQPQTAENTKEEAAFTLTAKADEALAEQIAAGFALRPARLGLKSVPAKRSVSSLAKGGDTPLLKRPSFMYKAGLSAAEKGTAQHTFMQFANFAAAQTDLEAEITRLQAQGFIECEMADAIDRQGIRAFLSSALAKRVAEAAENGEILREYDFITAVPAGSLQEGLQGELAEESVLVQGIADLVLVNGGKAEIVDYKTDRNVGADELAARYRPQLQLYKQALEKRLNMPVSKLTVWSFSLLQEVDV